MVISKVLFGHCNCLLLCFMPRFCKTAGNNPPCSGFGRFISYKLLKILRFVAHALPPPSPWHTQHSTSIPCGVCSTPPSQKRQLPGGVRRMSASKRGSVQGLRLYIIFILNQDNSLDNLFAKHNGCVACNLPTPGNAISQLFQCLVMTWYIQCIPSIYRKT